MSNNDIQRGLRKFMCSVVWMEDREIDPATDLILTGQLDSLGLMQVVSFIEEEWSIQVSSDEIIPRNFRSIEAMAAYVGRRLQTD